MKKIAFAVLATCFFSACATTVTHDNSPKYHKVSFSCTNQESLVVRFFPLQGVAVLVRNGQTLELQQQLSDTGFIYSNGSTIIRGKEDNLTVEIGRMVPIECSAR